jgi:putative flippase GtrA
MKKLSGQILKFCVVGGTAFLIDFGLLIFLTELCGLNYLISTTLAFSVALVFNYFASMRFVFERKEGLARHHEFIIFVVLSVIGLGINDLCMWAGVDVFDIDYRITKIAVTAIVMIWNFGTRKLFLEKRGG